MSDRLEQARAEAERRYPGGQRRFTEANLQAAFRQGVQWADANRTIAFSEVDRICNDVVPADQYHFVEVLEALGIEVTDDE